MPLDAQEHTGPAQKYRHAETACNPVPTAAGGLLDDATLNGFGGGQVSTWRVGCYETIRTRGVDLAPILQIDLTPTAFR